MDLEKRVELLEKEVQLLKGEIQALLLEMQDYLLTQAHPQLRGVTPEKEEQLPNPKVRTVPAAPAADHSEFDTEPDVPSSAKKTQVARQVQEEPTRTAPPRRSMPAQQPPNRRVAQAPTRNIEETQPIPPKARRDGWIPPHKLEEWATRKLKKYGVEQTRQIINQQAIQGNIEADQYDMLMQFVDLYELKHRPADADTFEDEPNAAKTVPNRSKLRTPSDDAAEQSTPPDDVEAKSSLILRLIAGVQNAGIGITRRSDNG